MRRMIVLAGVLALAMLVMGPAWAKGPTGATIIGPGIAEPIELEGNGEPGSGTDFAAFVEAAGFWQVVMDVEGSAMSLNGEVIASPPSDLGTRYTVTWHMGDEAVATDLYPNAAGGPVVHMAAQRLEFMEHDSPERWVAADPALLEMLDAYGVPFRPVTAPEAPVEAAEPVADPAPADPVSAVPWAIWLAVGLAAVTGALALGRRRTGAA
jgi:hypothetical protein